MDIKILKLKNHIFIPQNQIKIHGFIKNYNFDKSYEIYKLLKKILNNLFLTQSHKNIGAITIYYICIYLNYFFKMF